MHNNKKNLITTILALVGLVACIPEMVKPSIQQTTILTLVPTSTISSIKVASTLVSNPDYNKECTLINSANKQDQLDYRGILPGRTNEKEVAEILGPPENEYFLDQKFWNYENGNVSISFKRNGVSEITVSNYQNVIGTLENIILNNGCPDLIFVIDPREEPVGGYEATTFIYFKLGVEFTFGTFPVSLTDSPTHYVFFPPQPLDNYMRSSKKAYLNPDAGKPVMWFDAVK